ncbi:MAG TPA: hypothetical protein EYP30_02700 [Archaeoglobaceae archaeon]|nr:hypothetical protein [Archaeoglobaceae archaeon]
MAAYLPLLPFFAKYPFIRVASHFLDEEFENIIDFLKSEGAVEKEAKIEGEKLVLSIFKKTHIDSPSEYGFLCSVCDEKECKKFCEKNAFEDGINWNLCDLCGKCFKNCTRTEDYAELRFQAKKSLLIYLFSRIIISCLDDWVRRKYAFVLARRYRNLIRNEDESRINHILGILSADFDIKIKSNGSFGDSDTYHVHISSYLKAPSKLKSEKWRLVNRKLLNGYIELTRDEFIRLIEEYIKDRLGERLNVDDEIKDLVKPYLKNIEPVVFEEKKKAGKIKFERTEVSCFPPCMIKILEDLKSGVNVPHTARFAITSFLLNVGLDVEEIISMFSTAPDFDEEKTRYQVEHIAGAKGTEYDCPACDTMRTYHNCIKDCKTYHPVSYYEDCMRREQRMKPYKSSG